MASFPHTMAHQFLADNFCRMTVRWEMAAISKRLCSSMARLPTIAFLIESKPSCRPCLLQRLC